MKRSLLFLVPIVVWMYACGEAPQITEDEPEEVAVPEVRDTVLTADQKKLAKQMHRLFQEKHNLGQFNGNLLVAVKGKVIHHGQYGEANLKEKTPLKPDTKFQLASLSKPFTAYGILLLAQKGKINLQDNVKNYLPGFPYDGITIEMCLTHRSGMSNYMYFADEHWPDRYVNPIHNHDVLELYKQHVPPYYYPPNKQYDYSNTGYMMLASIIEKVSGKDFQTYMKEEVFDPIGMKNTLVYRKEKGQKMNIPNAAIGYTGRKKVAEDTYLNGVLGDKGVYSTTLDLLRFDSALREGSLLEKAWLDSAYVKHNEYRKNKDNYGYGWRIRTTDDGKRVIYHTGWWKGFRSYFIRDLDTETTIIALSNVKRGPFMKVDDLLGLVNIERPRATP